MHHDVVLVGDRPDQARSFFVIHLPGWTEEYFRQQVGQRSHG